MKGQAPAWAVGLFGAGIEGFLEPLGVAIFVAITVAFINALNLSSLTSASSGILLEYVAGVFVVTLAANFIKGLVSPAIAGASAIGMILGLIYLGSAVSAIAPSAVGEVIAYIIAAIAGIGLGIYINSKSNQD